jgi:hypothetical protein
MTAARVWTLAEVVTGLKIKKTMKMLKWSVRFLAPVLIIVALGFLTACGGSGGNDESADPGDIAFRDNFSGIWLITKEDTSSLWIFFEDGRFEKKRAGQPLNSTNHFSGTYSINEGFLSGSFTNPGVGDGEIEGTLSEDDLFIMNFIEYWHSPAKVVPCVGVRQ